MLSTLMQAMGEQRGIIKWVLVGLFLLVWSGVWLWLGQTTFFAGPSEWDDVLYADFAAVPRARWELRNRYVHIWSLRLFYELFESRAFAAGLYGNVVVMLLSWLAFILGNQIGGLRCGMLTAVLTPFWFPFLKFLTIPYVDPTMALWSTVAIVGAIAGFRSSSAPTRQAAAAWILAGVGCYLTIKSKETGLAVLPAVGFLLCRCNSPGRSLLFWFTGLLIGWGLLFGLHTAFAGPGWEANWRSSDWWIYFRDNPRGNGGGGRYLYAGEFVSWLSKGPYLVFAVLGGAGILQGAKRGNVGAVALAVWTFSSLAFLDLVAWRFPGIDAEDRYMVAPGIGLVVLGAYSASVWTASQSRGTDGKVGWRTGIWFLAIIAAEIVPLQGQVVRIFGEPTDTQVGAVHYLLPAVNVFLFFSVILVQSKLLRRLALTCLFVNVCMLNVTLSMLYVENVNTRMAPWKDAAAAMEKESASLVMWRARRGPYSRWRVQRRIRTLSERGADFTIRRVRKLAQRRPGEWVFTSRLERRLLVSKGWTRVAHGREKNGAPWSIYRPPNE